MFEIILDKTPFYAESGGQVGDRGILLSGEDKLQVIDTRKENNLAVHIVLSEPKNRDAVYLAKVDIDKR